MSLIYVNSVQLTQVLLSLKGAGVEGGRGGDDGGVGCDDVKPLREDRA